MANYYAVLFNNITKPDVSEIESMFDPLKDWLRFTPSSWLIYTDLRARDIRDRLTERFSSDELDVIVLKVDLSGWAAFSKPLAREWLRRERSDDVLGE